MPLGRTSALSGPISVTFNIRSSFTGSAIWILGFNILSGSETHVGWKAGFGFEHALTNNIIMRIEYAHLDLGKETHTLNFTPAPGLFTIPAEVEAKFDTVTLGVSYKF